MRESKPFTVQDIEQNYPELLKNILMFHGCYYGLGRFAMMSQECGYRFFCWNDVIYDTNTLQIVAALEKLDIEKLVRYGVVKE